MTQNKNHLEQRLAQIEEELESRQSTTQRQVRAALGRAPQSEDEDDRSKWSTTDHQVFAATGRKPKRIEGRGSSATRRQVRSLDRDE